MQGCHDPVHSIAKRYPSIRNHQTLEQCKTNRLHFC